MNVYLNRREKLLESLPENACLVLFSGKAVMKSEDEGYPFSVNRSFYYFTGLDTEGMVLMFSKLNGVASARLYILPYDEYLAKWVGGRMQADEAYEISAIEEIYDIDEFKDTFATMYNRSRLNGGFDLYLDLWHYNWDQVNNETTKFCKEVQEKYPTIVIKDAFALLTNLRLIKDEYEVSCIKHALAITKAGIENMMHTIRPKQNEMFMEGVFNFTLMRNLCNENAFKTIAASGKRATVLHYSQNNCVMEDGELFLCDLGATHKHYCADISRTFPVNGKFSERQKEIYELVLQAQKIVEANAKAGVRHRDLNKLVVDFYREELPKHGLNKDVSEYYFHGVSHHLGLDTHDSDGGLGAVLKAGMVITNEPGLYIEDENIGIRIEDDLLITEDGNINLAADIIKEVDDIEAFMNK